MLNNASRRFYEVIKDQLVFADSLGTDEFKDILTNSRKEYDGYPFHTLNNVKVFLNAHKPEKYVTRRAAQASDSRRDRLMSSFDRWAFTTKETENGLVIDTLIFVWQRNNPHFPLIEIMFINGHEIRDDEEKFFELHPEYFEEEFYMIRKDQNGPTEYSQSGEPVGFVRAKTHAQAVKIFEQEQLRLYGNCKYLNLFARVVEREEDIHRAYQYISDMKAHYEKVLDTFHMGFTRYDAWKKENSK